MSKSKSKRSKSKPKSRQQQQGGETSESVEKPQSPEISQSNNEQLENFNLESEKNDDQIEPYSNELFDLIHSRQLVPYLPSRSWAIHCTDEPIKSIVISKVVIGLENGIGLVPVYPKQLVFDERMNYELFLLNSKTIIKNKLQTIETTKDVERIIDHAENVKLCNGGPEISLYATVALECAYKDPKGRWRHNLCSLEVPDVDDVCESCLTLETILQRLSLKVKQNNTKRKRT